MTLVEIVVAAYIGLGIIWLTWFQVRKDRPDQPVDVFWELALNSLLIQILLVPIWPILLLLTWPRKDPADKDTRR